ncbi:homoserine dehydrogenase [bacterium]|nr:MAG: homoserine dehydrogenase [bacterium]
MHRFALIGFGNVGQAFARLLLRKQSELSARYNIEFQVNGIYTAHHGGAIHQNGLDLSRALALAEKHENLVALSMQPAPADGIQFISACEADVLFENSPVNHASGQPAVEHIRTALQRGMHAVTANKGPLAHAYQELSSLAAAQGKRFLFESTVMDGAPIFSLFREPLPALELHGFTGILNSCTNYILGLLESGQTFEQAVRSAQSIGIAETDPSADIDGWDAAIKVAILATVLMGASLTPQDIDRQGIREISAEKITAARETGKRWKLVCSAAREGGRISGRVTPQMVSPDSPFFSINGTSSYVQFETDVLPGLGIVESNPGPETTAYGLLADLINALA